MKFPRVTTKKLVAVKKPVTVKSKSLPLKQPPIEKQPDPPKPKKISLCYTCLTRFRIKFVNHEGKKATLQYCVSCNLPHVNERMFKIYDCSHYIEKKNV